MIVAMALVVAVIVVAALVLQLQGRWCGFAGPPNNSGVELVARRSFPLFSTANCGSPGTASKS